MPCMNWGPLYDPRETVHQYDWKRVLSLRAWAHWSKKSGGSMSAWVGGGSFPDEHPFKDENPLWNPRIFGFRNGTFFDWLQVLCGSILLGRIKIQGFKGSAPQPPPPTSTNTPSTPAPLQTTRMRTWSFPAFPRLQQAHRSGPALPPGSRSGFCPAGLSQTLLSVQGRNKRIWRPGAPAGPLR